MYTVDNARLGRIRRELSDAGDFTFSPGALAHWHMRVVAGPIRAGGAEYLVTSETLNPATQARRYTVRRYDARRRVILVEGAIRQYGHPGDALAVIQSIAAGRRRA